MKRTACSLAFLLLAAGSASAQTQSTTPDAAAAVSDNGTTPPPADASPPNVADHPGGPANTPPSAALPGVTVTKRTKPCGKGDVACREEISAEIWRKYPEQIATMCKNERIRSFRQGFDEVALGADGSAAQFRLTPQTEALCDYGPAHGLAAK